MSASLSDLIPDLQPYAQALVDLAGSNGLLPRVTSTLRTYSQQAALYRKYLAGGSAYPAAPPGHSAHEYGYAFDLVVADMSYLPDLGAIWNKAGGVWHPSDAIHFEFPGFSADVGPQIDAAQNLDDASSQSWQEQIISMFAPSWFGFAQMIAQVFPGISPEVKDAVMHPWKGMDWMVPQPLLNLRKRLLGV